MADAIGRIIDAHEYVTESLRPSLGSNHALYLDRCQIEREARSELAGLREADADELQALALTRRRLGETLAALGISWAGLHGDDELFAAIRGQIESLRQRMEAAERRYSAARKSAINNAEAELHQKERAERAEAQRDRLAEALREAHPTSCTCCSPSVKHYSHPDWCMYRRIGNALAAIEREAGDE